MTNKHDDNNKLLVTHNGTFHSDDIFATAALSILLDGKVEVVRTRDQAMFEKGDYVYDVGGISDPDKNRFDHHQKGGAGARANGIPYAAFGLVWKKYGEEICGSKAVAERIDEGLVQAIDADDNGVSLYQVTGATGPCVIQSVFGAFRPSWKEEEEYQAPFLDLVDFAKKLLERKIKKTSDNIEAESIVKKAYDEAEDKRLIILDNSYPWEDVLISYPEPTYVVGPKGGVWRVFTVQKEKKSFESRKPLPASWAGLANEDLARVTRVPDATFCHNNLFLAVSKSKEGAIELAKIALLA